jgi:hypothetical protein
MNEDSGLPPSNAMGAPAPAGPVGPGTVDAGP